MLIEILRSTPNYSTTSCPKLSSEEPPPHFAIKKEFMRRPDHLGRQLRTSSESVSCRCRLLLMPQIAWHMPTAAIQKCLHPDLQCQKLPDLHGPVLLPAAVFIDQGAHGVGPEQATLFNL